jgi:membrane fusion protein, multidrug efflux system
MSAFSFGVHWGRENNIMADAISDSKSILQWSRGLRLAAFLIISLILIACSQKKAEVPKPTVPVTTAVVEQKAVPYEIRAIGNIVEYASVNVRSQVGGYLSKIHFQKGQFVKKGSILFTIDARPYQASLLQAEGALAKDQAQLANARADESRYAELVKKGYISKQQYEQQQATANSLEAVVKADLAAVEYAKVQLSFCYIHAPISGRLGDILIDEGNLVKAADDNKFLVTIRQIQPIYVSFSVPEKNLGEIKKYMTSKELPVNVSFDKDDANPEKGVLTFIDNTVDPSTGTIRLKGTMKNEANRLWPGQFVNVVLSLYVQQDAVTVPSQAIQAGQIGQYVYVVKDDMTTETRQVVIARTFGNDSIIEKGLKPGEQVVTDGQLRISSGAKVQIKASPEADESKKVEPTTSQPK